MPTSKQRPLTAPRGGHEHDFSLPLGEWEAAVFDRAAYFIVVMVAERDEATGRCAAREFAALPEALALARATERYCLYAVAASGRFAMLDRERWDEWEVRWREASDERGRDTEEAERG